MTKIKNTDAYKLVPNPSLLDYLVGSRFLLDGKTENFQISSIIKLFNSANGISNVEFQFSDGSDLEIDPTTSGWFFTNNNETALDSFTHLIFNKEALGQLDLSVLFNKLETLENVILKLRSPEDPENFFTLKIISIENETDYFSIEVINSNDFSLGELLNNRIYGLYFDISSDDLKLDKADYTGNATDLDNRIEVLENLQDLDTNFTGRAYAIWTGVGFVYEAVYPAYYIQGVLYPSGTQLITLNTSDATNPRQDVIAVNATGAIKVTGTPALNPLVPTVDLATNIIITTILVPENATVPPGAVNENIYLDNAEWTGTSSGVSADFDYTNNVFSGTKCINLPSFAVSNYIDLTRTGNINIQNYRELTFRIRLSASFSTSSNITFRFGLGSISQSATVSLIHGRYGFNRSIIGAYQHIIIPLTAFTFTASDLNKLTISKSVGTASSFILDSIILTSNTTGGTTNVLQNAITSIITDQGISNATRDNDSIRLASQNDGLIIASYINKEIRFTSLFTSALKTLYDIAYSWIVTNGWNVTSHLVRTDNPHAVTKSQVGLGNVDNTSDINKPVSTAQATADGVVLTTANAYTDSRVSSVYVYKGNVANYASLPNSGQTIGWVWNLLDTGTNYAWTGTLWDELGTTIDISGKENTSNKTATVIGNESSTSLYLNILGAVTYFQQKFTDSIFGAFIVGLTADANPVDADSIAIVDSTDTNKAKKTTLTQLKAFIKTYFDTLYTSITSVQQYKTYFINTATGNNATGVYQDASKPFASIDYVNANFTIQDGDIFYLQGTGQTFVINNQLQTANQSFIANDTSTNTLDFSSNNNTNIAVTQSVKNYVINIVMRNGTVRNNRGGATGVNLNGLASYFTLKLDVREIYWNTSTLMYSINSNLPRGVFKAPIISCAKVLTNFWSEYLHVRSFTCLSTNAILLATASNAAKCNIRIDNINGTGSYLFSTNNNYLIGDISTTVACGFDVTYGQESYITFNNSVITGGGILLPSNANNLVFSGVIRSVTNFTNSTPISVVFKFINFIADFGTNKLNVNGTSTISFENCSIKSTNSPLGVVTNVSGGNFIIKNSTFEVINAVPLMTGGAGGARTLTVAGLSTNATVLSDQSGTGVTVNVIGKNSVADGVDSKDAVNKGQLDSVSGIAGSFSATGTATTTFTVTIGATQANNTYKVVASPSNALSAVMFYINNKTTTTFDVVFVTGLTGAVAFDWTLKP